ncbi:hypothetical protein ACFXHD_20480 [Streptomyces hydrogenans]
MDLLVMALLNIGAFSRQQADEQHRYEVGKGSLSEHGKWQIWVT